MRSPWIRMIGLVLVASMIAAGAGCSSTNKAEKGGAIGAAAGAATGALIGHATGSTATGAIIGAVVGGAAGAMIGHQMDKQAQELQQNIPGAIVERVGEGIKVTFASGLLFDFDSDVIRGNAGHNLDALADNLQKYPKRDLLIVGHTDAIGSESYNQDLSERRADAAARYLRGDGVSVPIVTRGLGKDEPVASNDNEEGRARNRRVEVAIYASEDLKDDARRETSMR